MVLGASGALVLLFLACPVSMGLMMVFMGRGMMGGQKKSKADTQRKAESVEELKQEQTRLAERIAALDVGSDQSSPRPVSDTPSKEPEDSSTERTPSGVT